MDEISLQKPGFTIVAFNGLMNEFLSQLKQILGEKEPDIAQAYETFKVMSRSKDLKIQRKPLDLFMQEIRPYVTMIYERDDQFIEKECDKIAFLKPMHLNIHWKDLDNDQKSAMWQFLNMLITLGNTITTIPPEMLGVVESMAAQLMDKTQKK